MCIVNVMLRRVGFKSCQICAIFHHDISLQLKSGVLQPPVRRVFQAFYPSVLSEYADRNINDLSIAQLVFFMSSALGSASCLSAVPVFSGQLGLIKREQTAGLSVIAYAVGRMSADLLFVIFNGMIFTGE